MKISSPLPHRRGRLEIIPLIDIMFFLLAAFMIVSINKIKVKSLKLNLPTDVPAAQKETKEDFISVSITAEGQVGIDKEQIATKEDLLARLKALFLKNKDQKFLISADKDARHGDVIGVLGKIRAAGFQKVAFSIKGEPGGGALVPAPASVPVAPPPPAAPAPASALPTPPAAAPALPAPPAAPAPPK